MDIRQVYRLEQQLLAKQLEVVRATLQHGGEKGRTLENYMAQFLRNALPQEYGIATGFIAFPPDQAGGQPSMSKQLDVIIYDALRGSPLVRLPTCDVLPLEAVLAYVEVKANVSPADIRQCADQARRIREHQTRWFWSNDGINAARPIGLRDCVATRSYVFAFEGPKETAKVEEVLVEVKKDNALAEFSGLFINGLGFFQSAPPAPPSAAVDALSKFRHAIIHGLARFPRYAPREYHSPNEFPSDQADRDDRFDPIAGIQPMNEDYKTVRILNFLRLETAYLDHYAVPNGSP